MVSSSPAFAHEEEQRDDQGSAGGIMIAAPHQGRKATTAGGRRSASAPEARTPAIESEFSSLIEGDRARPRNSVFEHHSGANG